MITEEFLNNCDPKRCSRSKKDKWNSGRSNVDKAKAFFNNLLRHGLVRKDLITKIEEILKGL